MEMVKDDEGSVPDKPLGSSDAQGFAPDFNRLKNSIYRISNYKLSNAHYILFYISHRQHCRLSICTASEAESRAMSNISQN